MSKAVGWTIIIALVVLAGAHPDALVSLVHHSLGLVQRAGNELATFVGRL